MFRAWAFGALAVYFGCMVAYYDDSLWHIPWLLAYFIAASTSAMNWRNYWLRKEWVSDGDSWKN